MKYRIAGSLLLELLLVVASAPHAMAADALLGFAQTYRCSDGGSATHRGLDVAQAEGTLVVCPMGGTVDFVGRIPGSGGSTILAVTVVDGARRVTMSPLEHAQVEEGDCVSAGAVIGSVASAGDASSSSPHVHVGLRVSGVYVDPSPLFDGVPASPGAGNAASVNDVVGPAVVTPATGPRPAVVTNSASPVIAPKPVTSQVPGEVEAQAPSGMNATVVNGARGLGGMTPLSAASPAQEAADTAGTLSPGVMLAPSPGTALDGPSGSGSGVAGLPRSQRADAGSPPVSIAISHIADAACAMASKPVALAAVAAAVFASILLLTRSTFTARVKKIEPMSDRLGMMLHALRAGGTVGGFTSCPGHSAFTDPGPPAQRR